MKKAIFVAILVIFLLAVASRAEGVSLSLPSDELTLGIGERKVINATVKNLQEREDIFSLVVWPPIVPAIAIQVDVAKPRVSLAAGSEVEIPLIFTAPECAPERNILFEITATSLTTEAVKDTKKLTLRLKGEGLTCITKLRTDRPTYNPGEKMKILTALANFAESGIFSLDVQIKKDKEVLKSFSEQVTLESRASKELTFSYALDEHALAGEYRVEALLRRNEKLISSRTTEFGVAAIEKLDITPLSKNFLVLQLGSIRIKNLGNAPSKPQLQNILVPTFMSAFFYTPIPLAEKRALDGQIVYTWLIPPLSPGQEYVIKYELRLWPIWACVAAVAILILFVYFHFYSIRVVKKVKPVGILAAGKEIPITISVANDSVDEIKDVLIRDLVPSIATVVEKFETLPPVKRRIKGGTELNWRIDSIKPGEEVILGYRIRPIVDIIGTLRLPEATIRYVQKGKIRKVAVSKPIIVAPKS